MYDENQIVQVKWNNNNKKWYESKGYIFTKRNNVFDIAVKDLMPHSNKKIIVTCDYCGKEYIMQYNLILNGRNAIQKDCCPNCTGKKTSEVSKQRRSEKYNLIIEFDGQHHYKITYSVEHYETTVRHDKIKNDYCKSHNIDLLRIPYWECNNIESIIADELNL